MAHIGRMSVLNIVLGTLHTSHPVTRGNTYTTVGVNCPIEIINENHFLNICVLSFIPLVIIIISRLSPHAV